VEFSRSFLGFTGGLPVAIFDSNKAQFVGSKGILPVDAQDEIVRKLAMLIDGECDSSPAEAAEKHGVSRARYFQLRKGFVEDGTRALQSKKRGPKSKSRRTSQVARQVIRHRFLDPDASSDVIAQKIRQAGIPISKRSVDRIIKDFGIQKKTLQA
jgi:transposase